jgi:hypothetical protein
LLGGHRAPGVQPSTITWRFGATEGTVRFRVRRLACVGSGWNRPPCAQRRCVDHIASVSGATEGGGPLWDTGRAWSSGDGNGAHCGEPRWPPPPPSVAPVPWRSHPADATAARVTPLATCQARRGRKQRVNERGPARGTLSCVARHRSRAHYAAPLAPCAVSQTAVTDALRSLQRSLHCAGGVGGSLRAVRPPRAE